MKTSPILLAFFCLVGCAEAPPSIRLVIDISEELDIPEELDRAHVSILASSPDGRVCNEVLGILEIESRESLPVLVLIERGTIYTENVAFEVSGYLSGDRVIEPHVGWARWPDSEDPLDIHLTLEARCFNLDQTCGAGERCIDGTCEPANLPSEFNVDERVDTDVDCSLGG